jgi:hypothetical protein
LSGTSLAIGATLMSMTVARERVQPTAQLASTVRVYAQHRREFWIITEADRSVTFLLPNEY